MNDQVLIYCLFYLVPPELMWTLAASGAFEMDGQHPLSITRTIKVEGRVLMLTFLFFFFFNSVVIVLLMNYTFTM